MHLLTHRSAPDTAAGFETGSPPGHSRHEAGKPADCSRLHNEWGCTGASVRCNANPGRRDRSGVSHNQRRNKAIAVVANIFNLRTGKISVRAVQCGNRIPQRLFQIGRRIEQAGSLYAAGLFQISSHFPFQPRVIRAECAHCCQMRPRRNNKRCRGPFFATPGTGKHPVSDHTAGHRPV